MKAILPVVFLLFTLACGGVKPVAIDFHLPALQSGDFSDSAFRQGWDSLQKGDTDAAYKSFQRSEVRLDKKQAAFGFVFLARKKYSAASAQFTQALETNPDNLEAALGMATIREFEGNSEAAFDIYGKLLAKYPNDAWIKLRYEFIQSSATQGYLLEAEKVKSTDKEKYIRALERADFFSPDMTAITLQIADFYYGENDWQRSLPYYESVLEKDAHNEAVLLKVASIYEKGEKFDLALVTLDRLLALKPGDPFLESEKRRIRDRFQEMNLPEKFKRIFFKSEIDREELAALIGFYFDRYIQMESAPEIITDIDGSFARDYIIKTCTSGIMSARPDHTFDRFSTPDRANLALILKSLISYLEKKGHRLHLTPLAATAAPLDLSPLHKNYDVISFMVNAQILPLDAANNFNPTLPVSPADVIYALKKILNSVGE